MAFTTRSNAHFAESAGPAPSNKDYRKLTTGYMMPSGGGRRWARLAAAAPGLGEAELRVLLCLCGRVGEDDEACVALSLRELAEAAGVALSAARRAVDGLSRRGYVLCRKGTARRSSVFRVELFRAIELPVAGVPPGGTLPVENADLSVPPGGTQAPGSVPPGGTLSTDSKGLFDASPRLDIEIEESRAFALDRDLQAQANEGRTTAIVTRVWNARPDEFDAGEIAQVRRLVGHLMRKLGAEECKRMHDPDAVIAARLLAVAPLDVLQVAVLQPIMRDQVRPGTSYGWWVAVALQRVHGLSVQQQRAARGVLGVVGGRGRRESKAERAEPAGAGWSADLVGRLAAAKGMGEKTRKGE